MYIQICSPVSLKLISDDPVPHFASSANIQGLLSSGPENKCVAVGVDA